MFGLTVSPAQTESASRCTRQMASVIRLTAGERDAQEDERAKEKLVNYFNPFSLHCARRRDGKIETDSPGEAIKSPSAEPFWLETCAMRSTTRTLG